VGKKAPRGVLSRLKKRGVVSRAEKTTAREVLDDVQKGNLQEKPWEAAMRRRNEFERQAYQAEAERLRSLALTHQEDQEALLRAAGDLEKYSKTLPVPKTMRQTMLEQLGASTIKKPDITPKKSETEHDR